MASPAAAAGASAPEPEREQEQTMTPEPVLYASRDSSDSGIVLVGT